VHALPNLGPGGTRAPARGMTGPKLGRRARTRPEPVKHELYAVRHLHRDVLLHFRVLGLPDSVDRNDAPSGARSH
jgi:hypothetical protein